jgi:CO/xanthine dehydrogenase Mo-binding subunit
LLRPTTVVEAVAALDRLGVDGAPLAGATWVMRDEVVANPDTDAFGYHAGPQGSRKTHIVGKAASLAAGEVREQVLSTASTLLEAATADLELADGAVRVKGSPQQAVPLGAVAQAATWTSGPIQGKADALRHAPVNLPAYLHRDVPPIEIAMLEYPDPNAPFGVKGVAEPPILPVAAVIANAVSDAVGKPFDRLPIRPFDVLAALRDDSRDGGEG